MATLKGAEIFASGTLYPGNLKGQPVTFTDDDIDGIVATFAERASAGRVPLKLGHNDEQPITDGQPALGWISRVWREGSKLLADFADVPSAVYDAIKGGLYKYVSVELSSNTTSDGLRRWVLEAAALLGADIPAVGNLKDLQALTLSARPGLRPALVFTLTRAIGNQEVKTMTDEEIKELRARFSTLESENARLKADSAAREAEIQKEKLARHRKEICAQFTAAEDSGRILPRVQHRFCSSRFYLDDVEVLKYSASDIETEIKDNEIPESQRKRANGENKMSDESNENVPAAVKFSAKVQETCIRLGIKLSDSDGLRAATKATIAAHPDLAKAYYAQFDSEV